MLTKALIVCAGVTAGLVNSLDFSGTIGLGSILVGLLVTILAGGANLRGRLLKDQIEGWKGNYQQEKEHAAMLEDRLDQSQRLATELAQELSDAKVVIQRLEQLPNLERLVRLMSETQEKQREFLLELHREGMAAHKKTFDAVEHIAVRIHPSTQKET